MDLTNKMDAISWCFLWRWPNSHVESNSLTLPPTTMKSQWQWRQHLKLEELMTYMCSQEDLYTPGSKATMFLFRRSYSSPFVLSVSWSMGPILLPLHHEFLRTSRVRWRRIVFWEMPQIFCLEIPLTTGNTCFEKISPCISLRQSTRSIQKYPLNCLKVAFHCPKTSCMKLPLFGSFLWQRFFHRGTIGNFFAKWEKQMGFFFIIWKVLNHTEVLWKHAFFSKCGTLNHIRLINLTPLQPYRSHKPSHPNRVFRSSAKNRKRRLPSDLICSDCMSTTFAFSPVISSKTPLRATMVKTLNSCPTERKWPALPRTTVRVQLAFRTYPRVTTFPRSDPSLVLCDPACCSLCPNIPA